MNAHWKHHQSLFCKHSFFFFVVFNIYRDEGGMNTDDSEIIKYNYNKD
jgi:hypothetical protein